MGTIINFDKTKAQEILESFNNQKPIENIQTANDMFTLAGVCFAQIMKAKLTFGHEEKYDKQHDEYREAIESECKRELCEAIKWYGMLAKLIENGEYDHAFDPIVKAMILTEDDKVQVLVNEGWKGK